MSEYKTFGEMTKAEKMAILEAWVDGSQIEFRNPVHDIGWHPVCFPTWIPDCWYRIAPTKPSIDWSHVHPDYKWLATDKNGKSFLFGSLPNFDGGGYWQNFGGYVKADLFSSFKPGTCKPEDSLVMRPDGI